MLDGPIRVQCRATLNAAWRLTSNISGTDPFTTSCRTGTEQQ